MNKIDGIWEFDVLTESQALEWLKRIPKYNCDPEWEREAAEEILLKTINNDDITKEFFSVMRWPSE